MLAIQARDTCPMPFPPPSFHSGQGQPGARDKSSRGTRSKGPAKVFPGPGTVTVSGGITFTASQTAKLAQWRTRFAGFCQSRMTKDYTCNRETRFVMQVQARMCMVPFCIMQSIVRSSREVLRVRGHQPPPSPRSATRSFEPCYTTGDVRACKGFVFITFLHLHNYF